MRFDADPPDSDGRTGRAPGARRGVTGNSHARRSAVPFTAASRRQESPVAMDTFILYFVLAGTFIDYGGGFYVKYFVYIVGLGYVLIQKESLSFFHEVRWDLAVFLFAPLFISLLHTIFYMDLGTRQAIGVSLSKVGSPAYLLLAPLLFRVGAIRAQRFITACVIAVAVVTLILVTLHLLGAVNTFEYADFVTRYRIALFSSDPRADTTHYAAPPIPCFSSSEFFPTGILFSLSHWPFWGVVIFLATVISAQRGLILGSLASACIWFAYRLYARHKQDGLAVKANWKSLVMGVTSLSLVLVFVLYVGAASIDLFSGKARMSLQEDPSMQERLGHLDGYVQKVDRNPAGLIVGFGPQGSFVNPFTDSRIEMTEMVWLAYLLWYGLPYTLLFYLLYFFRVAQLWRLRHRAQFTRHDMALVIGCAALTIYGNVNPILLTPLAFLVFAILRVRTVELTLSKNAR